MNREVEALIDELFTPVSREDVAEGLAVLRGAVKEVLDESEGTSEGDSEVQARAFEIVWNLPRRERRRTIAQLVVGEAVLRRLEKEQAASPPPVKAVR